jgi:soluble lytic murein transglycosylase-like protein
MVYAIARQESSFNPRGISGARALELMQMTPATGRQVANKFGASYDENRLLSDPIYNVQLGAAELGDLVKYYRGSYILFAQASRRDHHHAAAQAAGRDRFDCRANCASLANGQRARARGGYGRHAAR